MDKRQFKIVLVGDGAVGKTTYLKKLLTGKFKKQYDATLGVEVRSVDLDTTRGRIRFCIWDTAGQEKLGGIRPGYYYKADGIIAMYDTKQTRDHVPHWIQDVRSTTGPDIPVILIANKPDVETVAPLPEYIHRTHTVCVKTSTRLYNPLLHLAKELMNDMTLEWVSTDQD